MLPFPQSRIKRKKNFNQGVSINIVVRSFFSCTTFCFSRNLSSLDSVNQKPVYYELPRIWMIPTLEDKRFWFYILAYKY